MLVKPITHIILMGTQTVVALIEKFQSFNLSSIIDFDKFNGYAITHHSTTIEGSTLTENETRLLLDEGITPAGKPLLHSLMVQDHYRALLLIMQKAEQIILRQPSNGFLNLHGKPLSSEFQAPAGLSRRRLFL